MTTIMQKANNRLRLVRPPTTTPTDQKAAGYSCKKLMPVWSKIYNMKKSGALKVLMLLLKPFESPKSLSSEGLKGSAGIMLRHSYVTLVHPG